MTGDQLGRPDGWGSGVDLGFEVETEVEFAEVKIELGSHAVKAQAAGFTLDGGKDGVKSLVKSIGEAAVPVGEDSLPVPPSFSTSGPRPWRCLIWGGKSGFMRGSWRVLLTLPHVRVLGKGVTPRK